ncbi:DUF72 domain-containing protein [Auraticoccus monumenti]|uniref:Uncharacterized conserved protein YecE, DUF72 family n=1 Tax=Auraticoccus monumenti TaxID=675864 RepID=A0A1G7DT71_9ACTN|nr:DUF72 domain-containing protein [Auraticoccus monumenti]SDE54105.1 Uncharacterized conserved protein YecE, DUF72 family [Auraticoccus monumenti]
MTRIGISGWRYAGWRGSFYPTGLPQRLELTHAAERLSSVEVNGTFYSLQRPSSFAAWREQVPDGFRFAVKGGRFITHLKRLRDVEAPLANFLASGVLRLGPTLGPVLWQLPATVPFEPDVLEHFLQRLPRDHGEAAALAAGHDGRISGDRVWTTAEDPGQPVRHALEPRSETFRDPAFLDLARRYRVAVVVSDSAGRWPVFEDTTTDLVYVRLHGDTELYASGYSDQALDRWAERIRRWESEAGAEAWVYFDNDAKGHAPFDALRLRERLG